MTLSKQQVFDKVATHLLTQGARSIEKVESDRFTPACVYRGTEGRMCAAGCLIPDEMYQEAMEGASITRLLEFYPEVKALFNKDVVESDSRDTPILRDLQVLHDTQPPEWWFYELDQLAKRKNLDTTALNPFRKNNDAVE